jgi:hypothetical protein
MASVLLLPHVVKPLKDAAHSVKGTMGQVLISLLHTNDGGRTGPLKSGG